MDDIKGLIFDFDGTLADSLPVLLECVNILADKYGYTRIGSLESLKSVSFKKFIKNHIRLNPLRLYLWRREMRLLIREKRHRIILFDGVKELLFCLRHRNIPFYLLTSSPAEHNITILQRHKSNIFSGYYCDASLFNKTRLIKAIIKGSGISNFHLCYVGDEIKDADSSIKAGIRMIGVGWGMNDRQSLLAAGAFHVVDTPDEILSLVTK